MAAGRHLGFLNSVNLNSRQVVEVPDSSPCQISSKSVKRLQRYRNFCSVSRGRPSVILDLFSALLDHPRRIFDGLYCHANPSFPFGHLDLRLIHQCLSRPHSPRQTTAQSVHTLPHNYATKSPLDTMGRPKFTPKTAPSPLTITTLSNTPIPRPIPLTIPTTSKSTQPLCHSTLSGQTDRQTDRQMV